MARSKSSDKINYEKEIEFLQNKVSKLEQINKDLAAKAKNKPANRGNFFRSFGVTFFVTLSIVTFMLFNIANWVKASVLDTDGFVSVTQPLIEQPAVQQTLQDEISNALFENIDLQSELEQSLPENLKFLAGPLSSQVESFANQKVGEVLRSQELNDIWTTTLGTVHSALIEYLENEENDGVVSIYEVYAFAGNELSDSPISFLLNRQLPDKVGSITIAEITWIDDVRTYANYLDRIPIILLITSLLSFLIAIALALNKKMVIITTIALTLVFMIATLLAVVIGREITADQVQPQYAAAASEVYTVITNPLLERTQGYLAIFSIILLMFAVTSNLKYIVLARQVIASNSIKLINKYTPAFDYPEWLEWALQNRAVIAWTLFGALFVVLGLRIPPDYSQVIDAFITSIVMVLIYLLASQILIAAKQKQNSVK